MIPLSVHSWPEGLLLFGHPPSPLHFQLGLWRSMKTSKSRVGLGCWNAALKLAHQYLQSSCKWLFSECRLPLDLSSISRLAVSIDFQRAVHMILRDGGTRLCDIDDAGTIGHTFHHIDAARVVCEHGGYNSANILLLSAIVSHLGASSRRVDQAKTSRWYNIVQVAPRLIIIIIIIITSQSYTRTHWISHIFIVRTLSFHKWFILLLWRASLLA